jgi:hypothetical protein
VRAALAIGTALLRAGCAASGASGSAGPGGTAAAAAPAAEARAAEARAAETRAAEARAAEARASEARATAARAAVAATLLQRAEDQMAAAQYRSALALYDEFLRHHPGDPSVPRVRAARTAVERLVLAQAEIERLRRDADARQAEIDRLKADLERLRRIDLRPAPTTP